MNLAVDGDCAYVWLFGENESHPIARTVGVEAYLDITPEGKVAGIEILGWPKEGK